PGDFAETDPIGIRAAGEASGITAQPPIAETFAKHRAEILQRIILLVITVIPVVILAQYMAQLLDDGLGRTQLRIELAGVCIAAIVFLPETITSVRAGTARAQQRVVNLCLGAWVSAVTEAVTAALALELV